jgi:hypothetical protein
MIVMPSNNSKSDVHFLAGKYRDRLGWLFGIGGWHTPRPWLSYAIDNGKFPCFTTGRPWDESEFMKMVDKSVACEQKASWVVVPDCVGDRTETLHLWEAWAPRLKQTGIPLAFAAQDGMEFSDVPSDADIVFLGGTTKWKRDNIVPWCAHFPRVHVGRINTEKWLWYCDQAGAESCDGTGWFRGDKKQLAGLFHYLEVSDWEGKIENDLPVRRN